MFFRTVVLLSCILVYSCLFVKTDLAFENKVPVLHQTLPAEFQLITTGYLSELMVEVLFVKTSVFLGSVQSKISAVSYEKPLAYNLEVMNSLYPEFIDPYFFAQSFLAPISKSSAKITNSIHEKGIKTFPENFIIRFFHAFNYYTFLNDPLKSALAFKDGAAIPDAPPMFEHLAALFSGRGGNIAAGLAILKTMLANESNRNTIEQYMKEIEVFQDALVVEQAIDAYERKYQITPSNLNVLVPEFIKELPEMRYGFILTYTPPSLILIRK